MIGYVLYLSWLALFGYNICVLVTLVNGFMVGYTISHFNLIFITFAIKYIGIVNILYSLMVVSLIIFFITVNTSSTCPIDTDNLKKNKLYNTIKSSFLSLGLRVDIYVNKTPYVCELFRWIQYIINSAYESNVYVNESIFSYLKAQPKFKPIIDLFYPEDPQEVMENMMNQMQDMGIDVNKLMDVMTPMIQENLIQRVEPAKIEEIEQDLD